MDCLRSRLIRTGTLASLALALGTASAGAQTQTPPLPTPPPANALPAPAPLPTGARIAFVNLQVVFSESELGKAGQDRWRMFNDKLFANLSARDKEIQGLTDKIKTQQTVADEAVLRAWNQDLARLQREAQFARQEAQVQSDQLQQDLLADFSKKVQPVIDALRTEKGLHAILGVQNEPGGMALLSGEPGIDLSAELIKRLNARK
jgi:Skp family chaperone for outer membrane proteins